MPPALQIRTKIVLPATLLLAVAIAVTSFVSVSLVARSLEQRLQDQIEYVSDLVSRTDYALNPSILERLKPMIGAEIVTFQRDGTVVADTLADETQDAWLDVIRPPEVFERFVAPGKELEIREVEFREQPYRVALRRAQGSPETMVAFLVDTSDVVQAKRAIAKTVTILAVVMILVLSVIHHLVARGISLPLEELVDHTRKLAGGNWSGPVRIRSADEVGRLAAAFNSMAEQLRRSETRLLQSEKLAVTGQLAARVAHDIRNPLSSIKMQAQLLRGKLDPTLSAGLEDVLEEIDRVEWVVQGLLDLGRPVELQLQETRINDVVEDVLRITEAQLEHCRITVTKRLDPDVPTLMLDPDRLRQALRNVIVNAAEAMPAGGTLAATTSAEPTVGTATIEIADDGPGIDEDARERAFDPFFTTKREGVGLGLVNTRSIVQQHSGSIDLRIRKGGGTRVVITLPTTDRAPARVRCPEQAEGEPVSSSTA